MLNLGGFAHKIAMAMDKLMVDRCKAVTKHITEQCQKHSDESDSSKPNSSWYNQNLVGALNTLEDNFKTKYSQEKYPPFLNTETVKYYPDRRMELNEA